MANAPEQKVEALIEWCKEMHKNFGLHFEIIIDKNKKMYSSLVEGLVAMNR